MLNIQEKLTLLQKISGKTQTKLALDFGVSFVGFNNWWTGKSKPRKSAETKINKMLAFYGVKNIKTDSLLETKMKIILSYSRNKKNVLKKIISRIDLVDELSLRITYNSNAIEGSSLSAEDTAKIIFDKQTLRNKTLTEQLEATNHDKAFRYLLNYLYSGLSVNENLVKELHRILMAGIRDDAGTYRSHGVRIVGSFVPTANYLKISVLMKELFVRKASKDIIDFVSKFHADFEKIHPFSDGNGRVGRLILVAILLSYNIAPAIITTKEKRGYYKALQKAQLEGIYEPLQEFIYNAILNGYQIIF